MFFRAMDVNALVSSWNYGRQWPRILMELWTSMASYPHGTMDVNALESSCRPGRLTTLVSTLRHRLGLTHGRSLGSPHGSKILQIKLCFLFLWTSMASYPHGTMDVNALESSCRPGRLTTLVSTLRHRLGLTHGRSLGSPHGSKILQIKLCFFVLWTSMPSYPHGTMDVNALES